MRNDVNINIGDVVYCQFPKEEGGDLAHYCLVIEINEDHAGTRIRVAFGSSEKVSESGHLDWELVASRPDEISACGLRKPTRFDLRKCAWLNLSACAMEGSLPRSLYGKFKHAAISAGLI